MNGPLIKLQRQRLGLTQEDVASELQRVTGRSIDRSTVAGWETGRAYPDPRLLLPLAELLETTTDRLLKVEEVGSQATSP